MAVQIQLREAWPSSESSELGEWRTESADEAPQDPLSSEEGEFMAQSNQVKPTYTHMTRHRDTAISLQYLPTSFPLIIRQLL